MVTLDLCADSTTAGTWYDWNAEWSASSATTLTATTWTGWNADYTYTCSGTTTDVVWYSWVAETGTLRYVVAAPAVPQLTPEEVAENQRIAAEREQKRSAIKERAKEILVAHLDRQQRESFNRSQFFDVISRNSERHYQVHHGTVYELNAEGQRIRSFCIHPRVAYPEYDNMLAKKLMLEADEKEFLRIANATQIRAA